MKIKKLRKLKQVWHPSDFMLVNKCIDKNKHKIIDQIEKSNLLLQRFMQGR